MGQRIKTEELRDLLAVARKLRKSASASSDAGYVSLFRRAARALEQRANELAFYSIRGAIEPREEMDVDDAQSHKPVRPLC